MASESSNAEDVPTASAGTRERILEAARGILVDEGAEHLSLGRVAARAGVARGTIYYQFGSRAGLIDAVIRSMEIAARVRATREEDHTFGDVLRRVTGIWSSHHEVLRGIVALSGVDPEIREVIHAHQAGRRRRLAELVEEHRQDGRLRADPADAVDALWMLTSFRAYDFLRERAGHDHERAHALLEALADSVLAPD